MNATRLKQLSDMAQGNDEVALQLQSELALDPQLDRENAQARFERWAEEEAGKYIAPKAAEPAPEDLDRLSQDIDF